MKNFCYLVGTIGGRVGAGDLLEQGLGVDGIFSEI